MKGIQDLIRPCATLARYEAALAAGTITQDVMVFIADVRQIRWKGEIYDCSVTALHEDGKTYIHADGFNSENDEYYYLPNSAPDDDPAHTFAMLSDLQNAGGVSREDFDALYDGVVEAEEVAAAALNELNTRVNELAENLQGEAVTKEQFEGAVNTLTDVIIENEEVTAFALNELDQRSKDLSVSMSQKATKEEAAKIENNWTAATLNNEEIIATALVDLDNRIKAIMSRLEALENI